MRDPKLLVMSGNSHPVLAEAIAGELGIGLVASIVGNFPDSETRIEVIDNIRGQDVFVVQPGGRPTNQNVMEGLLMIDALQRASAGRITLVAPYYPYARQDRKEKSRVPISAKLVTNLFTAAGADRLLAVDLHAHQIQGFTDRPFDHLYAGQVITDVIRAEVDHPVVIAPDVGAGKMAKGYARRLGTDFAIVDKEREDAHTTHADALFGQSVAGRNALLVDDIVSTAGSLLSAADMLRDRGAKGVTAAVTHGVLCGDAIEHIEASQSLDMLYVTDSLPEVVSSEKIRRITIAPLLARAIFNIHNDESVSGLF